MTSLAPNSFDSRQLQSEIENIKKMRQNYGAEWLLSTSSLLIPATTTTVSGSKAKSTSNESERTGKEPESTVVNEISDSEERTGSIIDSFAVYRSIEFSVLDLNMGDQDERKGALEEDNQTKTICILSVTENCLVEKDETNSSVLCFNEIANLSDIKTSTKTK